MSDSVANPGTPQRLSHLTLMGLLWTLLGTGSQLFLQLIAVLVLARILPVRQRAIAVDVLRARPKKS